jgi:hypothetical protein
VVANTCGLPGGHVAGRIGVGCSADRDQEISDFGMGPGHPGGRFFPLYAGMCVVDPQRLDGFGNWNGVPFGTAIRGEARHGGEWVRSPVSSALPGEGARDELRFMKPAKYILTKAGLCGLIDT